MPGQSLQRHGLWESAKPIMEALKSQKLPELQGSLCDQRHRLSLDGRQPAPQQQTDDDNANSQSTDDMLDRLKDVTFLQPKTKRDVQPGVVQQPLSAAYGSVWFGFSKDFLALKPEDKEVTFRHPVRPSRSKTKFVLKDMMYRGELAI